MQKYVAIESQFSDEDQVKGRPFRRAKGNGIMGILNYGFTKSAPSDAVAVDGADISLVRPVFNRWKFYLATITGVQI